MHSFKSFLLSLDIATTTETVCEYFLTDYFPILKLRMFSSVQISRYGIIYLLAL